jgi:hypothetical protein
MELPGETREKEDADVWRRNLHQRSQTASTSMVYREDMGSSLLGR